MSENTNDEPENHRADIAWLRRDNIAWFIFSLAGCIVLVVISLLLSGFIVQTWIGDMNEHQEQTWPGLIGLVLFVPLFIAMTRIVNITNKSSNKRKGINNFSFKDALVIGIWMISVSYFSSVLVTKASLLFELPVYLSGLNVIVPLSAALLGSMFLCRTLRNRDE